jgi:elongation factor P hydroxylase
MNNDGVKIGRGLSAKTITSAFNAVFFASHNTRLCGGGSEPIYLPSTDSRLSNQIIFSHDYAASALHEVAHWCVAGEHRRTLEDYGYWYSPDGRSDSQQKEFESVEIKPQALEWIFSVAADLTFKVSADNLESNLGASALFKHNIHQQVITYLRNGMPSRPQLFLTALARVTGVNLPLSLCDFSIDEL